MLIPGPGLRLGRRVGVAERAVRDVRPDSDLRHAHAVQAEAHARFDIGDLQGRALADRLVGVAVGADDVSVGVPESDVPRGASRRIGSGTAEHECRTTPSGSG